MNKREGLVGLIIVSAAVLLIVAGVPHGIASPRNVDNFVLSPLFWPGALSWALLLAGIALVARAALEGADESPPLRISRIGLTRLAAFGALLAGYVATVSWAGLSWVSIAAGLLMVAGVRSRYWKIGAIIAVLLPPALYGFFTHIAGVPIPRADLSRFFLL